MLPRRVGKVVCVERRYIIIVHPGLRSVRVISHKSVCGAKASDLNLKRIGIVVGGIHRNC